MRLLRFVPSFVLLGLVACASEPSPEALERTLREHPEVLVNAEVQRRIEDIGKHRE